MVHREEMGDAVRNHAGLSASSACQYEQWSFGSGDCFDLRRVESRREQLWFMRGMGCRKRWRWFGGRAGSGRGHLDRGSTFDLLRQGVECFAARFVVGKKQRCWWDLRLEESWLASCTDC